MGLLKGQRSAASRAGAFSGSGERRATEKAGEEEKDNEEGTQRYWGAAASCRTADHASRDP